jgi:transcriptional regulator with XRE-family HTH domain
MASRSRVRVTLGRRTTVKAPTVRGVTGMDRVIGVRLRGRRLEQHMSQEELANKIGVSFQQVQKYEKGVNRIGSARLVEIARILECDTSYFLADLNGNGGKSNVTVSRFAEFMATKDGLDINEAMVRLSEPHRRGVIDLARSLVRAYGD